jgi:protein-tyrosine phosphatase
MTDCRGCSPRKFIFTFLMLIFWLSLHSALAQQVIQTPILTSTPNFRDLAGISASNGTTGFANTTSHGGVMRPGVFYRSDYLSLSNADRITISTLHIGRDIDLRTPAEIQANPDVLPYGAVHTNINIFGTPSPAPDPITVGLAAAVYNLQTGYRGFVTNPVQRSGFGAVLLTLANDSTPDLYHCSAGKDRTGWTSALLQSIAGVPQEIIMRDYLATDRYTAASIRAAKAALLAADPGLNPGTLDAVLGVQPSYLQTAFDQVIASYGSMAGYLTRGLGLTQADIYVLRAKMVYYPTVPGQGGFSGNAASGAAFLNALQNSPLSGHYTAYNYYLQSAIDAETLSGVERQAGGQVHTDAAASLLRMPQWIDEATEGDRSGRNLLPGQTRYWITAPGGSFQSNGGNGIDGSTTNSAGSIIGATRRFNDQTSANLGIGYNWASVGSADGSVALNTLLATAGGRYAFSALEAGPYVTGTADVGWVDYKSARTISGGLGTASGNTSGLFYSGLVGLGDVFPLKPVTIRLQGGLRLSGVNLSSFNESGSDLALNVNGMNSILVSLPVDADFSFQRQQVWGWSVTPSVTLGYERILTDPRIESSGTIYGFSVSQSSAFNSSDLMKAGLGVNAQCNDFIFKAGINGVIGDGGGSSGFGGQLTLSYRF